MQKVEMKWIAVVMDRLFDLSLDEVWVSPHATLQDFEPAIPLEFQDLSTYLKSKGSQLLGIELADTQESIYQVAKRLGAQAELCTLEF